jgi:hypothetical protein
MSDDQGRAAAPTGPLLLSVGKKIELQGLQANPELNGKTGLIVAKLDATTGRVGVRLSNGMGLCVKPANLMVLTTPTTNHNKNNVRNNSTKKNKKNNNTNKSTAAAATTTPTVTSRNVAVNAPADYGPPAAVRAAMTSTMSPEDQLADALAKLAVAGGTEEEEEEEQDGSDKKEPHEYLNELLAVADARTRLGQFDAAGNAYYRAYYADIARGPYINNPSLFPIAYKMVMAWSQSDAEHVLKMAHGMAEQTIMMPGCPVYMHHARDNVARTMRAKGLAVVTMREQLRNFHMGNF